MKKLLTIVLLVLGTSGVMFAQQDPQFSMYMFNGLVINPAYAGSRDVVSLTGIFRKQWVNIEGAPTTASFSAHSPLRYADNNALGGYIMYDKIGVSAIYDVYADYAYRVPLNSDKSMRLSLGIQAGFDYYDANLTNLDPDDSGDPSFSIDESAFMPNVGVGAYLYSKRFYVGLSVPHLLNNTLEEKLDISTGDNVARQYNHYFATAGIVVGKDEATVKFKPSILFKGVMNAPPDMDLNASFLFIDRLWLGATYRMGGDREENGIGGGESIIGIIEFLATQQLRIGYAYDYSLSSLSDFNSGSHEIMLGYDFEFEGKRTESPRYIKYF